MVMIRKCSSLTNQLIDEYFPLMVLQAFQIQLILYGTSKMSASSVFPTSVSGATTQPGIHLSPLPLPHSADCQVLSLSFSVPLEYVHFPTSVWDIFWIHRLIFFFFLPTSSLHTAAKLVILKYTCNHAILWLKILLCSPGLSNESTNSFTKTCQDPSYQPDMPCSNLFSSTQKCRAIYSLSIGEECFFCIGFTLLHPPQLLDDILGIQLKHHFLQEDFHDPLAHVLSALRAFPMVALPLPPCNCLFTSLRMARGQGSVSQICWCISSTSHNAGHQVDTP